jgi:hypothetical protein
MSVSKPSSPFSLSGVLFLLSATILFSGCDAINPTEEIPGYVKIDSIRFETDYQTQGSSKYEFVDSWIYLDNDYLGTFENPRTFPVLASGTHKLSVRAGILENGIAATRSGYMKLVTFDTLLDFKPDITIPVVPRVHYFTSTQFKQMEDFDDGGISLVTTDQDYAPLQLSAQGDTNAFEGACGVVTLDQNKHVFEVASDVPFVLPYTSSPYIELNYKGEAEFTIGVFITTASSVFQSSLISVRSSTSWKKIFVNLRDLGVINQSAVNYKVYLHAVLPYGSSTAKLYFDNLKVLY